MSGLPYPESAPVFSCAEALAFEQARFSGPNAEAKEWEAMQAAGAGVGDGILRDACEHGGLQPGARILVLVGKGHNGGDALIAAQRILAAITGATADVCLVFGERALRPLAARAWRELQDSAPERVRQLRVADEWGGDFAVCLDGIFGFQYRSPLPDIAREVLERAQRLSVSFRAAVDLPSGLAEPGAFRADFTYATGTVKDLALTLPNAGRVRWVDLGWDLSAAGVGGTTRVLRPALLAPLAALRPSAVDKRSFGHVGILAGSRHYPGAALLAVKAALRSGAGLVSAFVPESLVPAFAAAAPEAIWVGWPETPDGGLALEGRHLIQQRGERIDAWVIGPGLGREAETLAWVAAQVAADARPVVLDADALQPGVLRAVRGPCIVTPHAGEWSRIAAGLSPEEFTVSHSIVVVAKGPMTRVVASGVSQVVLAGGPVLARGGSGDVLAGLIGGLLAQAPTDPVRAAARGALWHARAADALARERGQVAVATGDLLDRLPSALRGL